MEHFYALQKVLDEADSRTFVLSAQSQNWRVFLISGRRLFEVDL